MTLLILEKTLIIYTENDTCPSFVCGVEGQVI